jgi:hypothetical protein
MPIMKALYSLVSRARTICALGQAVVTFVRAGPSALAPVQLLLLGCTLCLVVSMLIPSPPASGSRRAVFVNRLCRMTVAAAVVNLTVADVVGSCIFLGSLPLGV